MTVCDDATDDMSAVILAPLKIQKILERDRGLSRRTQKDQQSKRNIFSEK
jgi:hypothetical protein